MSTRVASCAATEAYDKKRDVYSFGGGRDLTTKGWVETIPYLKGLAAVSGRLPATLLILLAAAAGAGIIAPDFSTGADRFGGFGLRGSGLILQLLLALPAFDFASFFFRTGRLNQEQIASGLAINAAHHVFEQSEGFFFEFDQWIFLAVAAQADAFLEVIEAEEMVFPLGIHDIENDPALEPAHHGRAEERLFLLIAQPNFFDQRVAQLIVRQTGGIQADGLEINAKLAEDLARELRQIPLLWMLFARAESVH